MHNKFVRFLVAALASSSILAQTTNVACENDYYVLGGGGRYPGIGIPCNPAASVNLFAGTSATFVVDTGYGPSSLTALLFALGPCVPNTICLPVIACGIPVAGAPCFSNQTGDLALPFPLTTGFTAAVGCQSRFVTSFVFHPALAGVTLSTQAAILPIGVSCAVPSGFVVTEAFNIQLL